MNSHWVWFMSAVLCVATSPVESSIIVPQSGCTREADMR